MHIYCQNIYIQYIYIQDIYIQYIDIQYIYFNIFMFDIFTFHISVYIQYIYLQYIYMPNNYIPHTHIYIYIYSYIWARSPDRHTPNGMAPPTPPPSTFHLYGQKRVPHGLPLIVCLSATYLLAIDYILKAYLCINRSSYILYAS